MREMIVGDIGRLRELGARQLASDLSLVLHCFLASFPVEVLSFLSRPVSHSVRLFANMLAGHITLQVFAGFIIMLAGAGILGIFGATLPFIMVVMLTALELLVAFLQAYVFAILTCIYLNDAIHPGH